MRLDFKMSGEIIFWYICNHIFSQHKYVPCPFSNWIHRAATWIQLVKCVPDIETDIPYFIISPHPRHRLLAVSAFVSNCFQEWSTRKEKLETKSQITENWGTPIKTDVDADISQYNFKYSTHFMVYSFTYTMKKIFKNQWSFIT